MLKHITVVLLLLAGASRGFAQSDETEFEFAKRLYDDRMYGLASEQLARFVQNYPSSRRAQEAHMLLARARTEAGQLQQAIDVYQGFIIAYPDDFRVPECWFRIAGNLQGLGRYRASARTYLKLHKLFPVGDFAAESLFRAGECLELANQPRRAIEVLQDLVRAHPKSAFAHQAHYCIARSLLSLDRRAEALAALETLLSSPLGFAEKPLALQAAAELYLEEGDVDQAQTLVAQLRKGYPGSAALAFAQYRLGARHLEDEALRQAAEALSSVPIEALPDSLRPQLLLKLAEAHSHAQEYPAAIEAYSALLESAAVDSLRMQALWGLGQSHAALKHYAQSSQAFREIVERFPHSPQGMSALLEIGDTYLAQSRPLMAIGSYQRYLEAASDPLQPDGAAGVQYKIAQLYETSLGWLGEAASQYKQVAAGTSPYAPLAAYAWARCLDQDGQARKAAAQYRSFWRRHPHHRLSTQAAQRAEYLEEFSPADGAAAVGQLMEALAGLLSGQSEPALIYELGRVCFEQVRDFERAISLFETYLSAQPTGQRADHAQYWIAVSYGKLARRRALESDSTASQALLARSEQAYQHLLDTYPESQWADEAALFLIERQAARGQTAGRFLVASYLAFRERYPSSNSDDLVLFKLGNAFRSLMGQDAEAADKALGFYRLVEAEHPTSPWVDDAWYAAGEVCESLGQYDSARPWFERVAKEFPDGPLGDQSLWHLADIASMQGQHTDAIKTLRELLERGRLGEERAALARFRLAEAHFKLGQWAEAVALYEQLARAESDLPERQQAVAYHLARACQASGNTPAALAQYETFLERHPQAAEADTAALEMGNLCLKLGKTAQAEASFRQLASRFPSSPLIVSAQKALMRLCIDAQRYEEALAAYRAISGQLGEHDAYLAGGAAVALFRVDQIDNARKAAKLFKKRYGQEQAWLARFQYEEGLYYERKQRIEKAHKAFSKAADMKDPEWSDDAAFRSARLFYVSKAPEAASALQGFLRDYPDSPYVPGAHMRLGGIYYGKGLFVEAIDAYRGVIQHPQAGALLPDAMFNAILCYEKLSRYADALALAQDFLHRFPDNESAFRVQVKTGVFLMELGRFREATDVLEAAYPKAGVEDEAEIRFYVAECYYNLRDFENAVVEYLKVAYLHREQTMWAVTAEYKAAQSYEELGNKQAARSLYTRMIVRYGAQSDWSKAAQKRLEAMELDDEG